MFVDISGSWEDVNSCFLLGLNFFHSSRNTLKKFEVLQRSVKDFGSDDSLGTNMMIQKIIGNFPAEKYLLKVINHVLNFVLIIWQSIQEWTK